MNGFLVKSRIENSIINNIINSIYIDLILQHEFSKLSYTVLWNPTESNFQIKNDAGNRKQSARRSTSFTFCGTQLEFEACLVSS